MKRYISFPREIRLGGYLLARLPEEYSRNELRSIGKEFENGIRN